MRVSALLAASLLLAAPAAALPPPITYTSQPGATNVQGLRLTTFPSKISSTVVIPDQALEVWQHTPNDTFFLSQTIPVPGLYAQMPLLLTAATHDVFLAADLGSSVEFSLRTSGGGSIPVSTYPVGVAPPRGSVVISNKEMNGQSGPDVAILVQPDEVVVFGDDGAAALDPVFGVATLPAGTAGDFLASGDVDGDGLADLIVGDSTAGECHVLRNVTVTTPAFTPLQRFPLAGIKGLVAADMDGDLLSDLVVIRDPDELLVASSAGGVNPFSPAAVVTTIVDQGPLALAVTDILSKDGDADVLVACAGATNPSLSELSNSGSGTLALSGYYWLAPGSQVGSMFATAGVLFLTDPVAGAFTAFVSGGSGNHSGADGFVLGPGAGATNPPRLRYVTGAGLPISTVDLDAYAVPSYGVRVAAGDVDGSATLHALDDVVTGPGPGEIYGPQVRAFRRDGTGVAAIAKINFYAYGTLKYGVNVSSANIDPSYFEEIVTGAGPGAVFGPHVRAFNLESGSLAPLPKVSFFAYFTLKYGVNVATINVPTIQDHEILTAPGPGAIFSPQIRAFAYGGTAISPVGTINFTAFQAAQYGATAGGGEMDAVNYAEDDIAASPGPGPGASFPGLVRGFGHDAGVYAIPGAEVLAFPTYYGARTTMGRVYNPDAGDVISGAGPDPAADSTVKSYAYDGGALVQNPNEILAYPAAFGYGVDATAGALAF